MPSFLETACADSYPPEDGTHGPILSNVFDSPGGYFLVEQQDAICQLQYGRQGDIQWSEDKLAPVGAGILPPGTIGIQFRNRISGQVALASASLALPKEPPMSLGASGTAGGAPTVTSEAVILGADVALAATNAYSDALTLALTEGTWLVTAEILVAATAATRFQTKLWDGAGTTFASSESDAITTQSLFMAALVVVSVAGLTIHLSFTTNAALANNPKAQAAMAVNSAGLNATQINAIKVA